MLGFGIGVSSLAGKSWAVPFVSEMQPVVRPAKGVMVIRLSDFPVLNQPYGSVRIGTSPIGTDPNCPQSTGLFPPVLITRGPNSDFHVMSAACTHEETIVPTFPTQNGAGGRIVCPCHGSQYLFDGTVVVGPAGRDLDRF